VQLPSLAAAVSGRVLRHLSTQLTVDLVSVHAGTQVTQAVQLALTNRQTLVRVDVTCCADESCPLVNDCDSPAGCSDFYLPLSIRRPQ